MRLIISSILAGIFIGIGATAYLLCDNRYIGALLFAVGLFAIKRYNLALFTGRVPYALEIGLASVFLLPTTLWGNITGTFVAALLLRCTRLSGALVPRAAALVETKAADDWWSLFILAALCNVMIYLATRKTGEPLKDTVALLFGVTVFVLCGFEHCVADCFYWLMSDTPGGAWLIPAIAGNTVGGIAVHEAVKFANGEGEANDG